MKTEYRITMRVFDQLACIEKPEACGFVSGRGGLFEELYDCPNLAKHPDEFRIGFLRRVRVGLGIVYNGHDTWALYHVHKRSRRPSRRDLVCRRGGDLLVVVQGGAVLLFKVVEGGGSRTAARVGYEVV